MYLRTGVVNLCVVECSFLSTVSSHGALDRAQITAEHQRHLPRPDPPPRPKCIFLFLRRRFSENGKLLHNPRPCEEMSKVEGI